MMNQEKETNPMDIERINKEDDHAQEDGKVQYQDQEQTKNQNTEEDYQPLQNYVISKTLGKGNFGKVKLATHKLTNQLVAVKILQKQLIFEKSDIVRISRQLKIMKLIRHPFVIQLYQIIQTPKQLYLIMEYAEKGDLFDKIVKLQRFQEGIAAQFYSQIALGLQYLHDMGVTHRDLKPQNILIDKNNTVKIADFGLGNMFKIGEKLKTACGSPCYAAPQMLNKQQYDPRKIDIWSSGIILYAMVCGYLPFQDKVTSKLYDKIKTSNYKLPSWVSNSCRNLIRGILTKDPSLRWDIQVVLQHEFLTNQVKKLKQTVQKKQINQKKLNQVCQKYGILQQDRLINSLRKNKHSNLTTLYYLGLKSLQKQQNCLTKVLVSNQFQQIIDAQQEQDNQIKENKSEQDFNTNIQTLKQKEFQQQPSKIETQQPKIIQKAQQIEIQNIKQNDHKEKINEEVNNQEKIQVQEQQNQKSEKGQDYNKEYKQPQNTQQIHQKIVQQILTSKQQTTVDKIQQQSFQKIRNNENYQNAIQKTQIHQNQIQNSELNKYNESESKINNQKQFVEQTINQPIQSQAKQQQKSCQLISCQLVQQNQNDLNLSPQVEICHPQYQNNFKGQSQVHHHQNLFNEFKQKKFSNLEREIQSINNQKYFNQQKQYQKKTQEEKIKKSKQQLQQKQIVKSKINKESKNNEKAKQTLKNKQVQQKSINSKNQNKILPKSSKILQKIQQKQSPKDKKLKKSERIKQYKPQSRIQDLANVRLYERSHSKDRPIVLKSKINQKFENMKSINQKKPTNNSNKSLNNNHNSISLNDNHNSISPSSAQKYKRQQNQLFKKRSQLSHISQSDMTKKTMLNGKQLQIEPYLVNPQKIVLCNYQKLCKILDFNGFIGKFEYFNYQDQYLYIAKSNLKLSTKAIQKGKKTTLQRLINEINSQESY